ncbi:pyridoxal phosphate-dependent decarboxylase family protein [Thalassotalea fusca]
MSLSTDNQYFLNQFNELASQFLSELNTRQVAKFNTNAPKMTLLQEERSNTNAVELLRQHVLPYLSASAGPRYWGFVTGGANPAALFADWLVSTFDQNVSKDGDSIASAIERQALLWLRELFYLPDTFNGIITTGATSANFLGAVIAREYAGKQQAISVSQQGMQGLSVELFSASPHASMIKSLGLAGFGQQQITVVNTIDGTEQMDVSHLAQQLTNSTAKSKIVIASSATVTATSFDDLHAISALCKQHQAWLHVDAAFGIFERLVNGENGKTQGIDLADSITVDFHKWLNVPYDAGAIFTRHPDIHEQSCNVDAPYLTNDGPFPAFLSLGIENSRRFRALPIWLTLVRYGRDGISAWVDRNIALAKELANWLAQQDNFELVIECQLNVVVFRPVLPQLNSTQADIFTRSFLQKLNQAGVVFLTPGSWEGKQVIRAALSNWQTTQEDIELAKASLQHCFLQLTNE